MSKTSNAMRNVLALVVTLAMVLGMVPGAMAAEAPPPAEEPPMAEEQPPVQEEAPTPEEAPAPEQTPVPEETAQPMPELTPAPEVTPVPETPAPDPTEPPLLEPTPAPELTPEPQDEPAAASVTDYDPEDPIYYKMSHLSAADLPSAASVTTDSFDKFTPRALSANETLRLGVDVSAYQHTINWAQAAASGLDFAIIRAAYRTTGSGELKPDSYFAQNLAGAKAAGLKVGAYIFSQAITQEEAIEEARYLMDLVRGYSIDLPLVFDFEYAGGRLYQGKLSRQEGTDVCNAFCREIENGGYESMVYSNLSMLYNDLYREQMGRLWLAHWAKKTTYTGPYEYWQCGYDKVNGIEDVVDMDFWFDPGGKQTPPSQQQVRPTATPKPTATPEPTPKPPELKNPFGDVSSGSWYYSDVLAAYGAGIVKGQTDTAFAPNATATRGQVVTMLYRMEGEPAVPSTAAFLDLTQDYYKNAVNWAAAKNIVSGTSSTTFSPGNNITREQLATMLYRMAGSPSVSGDLSKFSDGSAAQGYAQNALIWAVSKDIVRGNADGTLAPGASATRAEVCAMLMRYDKL